jgi:hypothetical protein
LGQRDKSPFFPHRLLDLGALPRTRCDLGRVVAIRDSRRPVRIRLLANALKHPIVLLNVQAPLRSALFREDCLPHVE